MTTLTEQARRPNPDLDRVKESLARGEILRLLSCVERGVLSANLLEEALADRARRQWFKNFLTEFVRRYL